MSENRKLDLILAEIQATRADVQELKTEMREVKADVQELKTEMREVKADVQELKTEVEELKTNVGKLEIRVGRLEQRTAQIELVLENEIRTNIQRVAEGHLDISRHLQEAMRSNDEVEMLAVRVNILETDVRKLKDKVS